MKKIILAVTLVLCLCLVMMGCKRGKTMQTLLQTEITENTTMVLKDGKLQSAIVESFDKEYYKEEELKAYLEEQIAEHAKTAGEEAVKLESLEVKNKVAYAKFSYASATNFSTFNELEAYLLTKEEAKSDSRIPSTLLSASEGKEVSKGEALETKEYQVFMINSPSETVIVNGEILYYANATFVNENTVQAGQDGLTVVIFK